MIKTLISLLVLFLSALASAQEASISRTCNLRSVPSSSGRIVGSVRTGASVTVISKYPRAGYVRVQTAGDDTGWVYQKYVTPVEAKENPAAEPKAPQMHGAGIGDQKIYANAALTPGKPDPSVTQGNIRKNICRKGWSTESVRPEVSVTDKIKSQALESYGFTDAANHYELDHLLSLQNGGCPDCVENLWPQAYGDPKHPMTQKQRAKWNRQHPGSTAVLPGALEKDLVENHIHDEICFGIPNAKLSMYAKKYPAKISVTLKRGQEILATDWFACYRNMMDDNKPCE